MTVTKINIPAFKKACEEARSNYSVGGALTFRDELEDALSGDYWKNSDEWKAAQSAVPATFEEVCSQLRVASARLQDAGATDAQIKQIAHLVVRDGLALSAVTSTTLSQTNASNMIAAW
jgi:hypothetical protein